MRIDLNARIKGLAEMQRSLACLSGQQAARAYAKALNDAGFEVRRAMQEEMRTVFDRPTRYVLSAPRVKQATPDSLSVTIEPSYPGGKGIDPQRILNAQTWGGPRRDKRSEVALRRAGVLPAGYQLAIPDSPFPGTTDSHGNLKGSTLVQLISYFQAFGEQGYRANMTDRRRRSIHKGGKQAAGRRYFVAYGGLRGGARTTQQGEPDRRASNLARGIWAASGTGGVDVRPVVMFVRDGAYRPRFEMDNVAKRADVDAYLERRVRFRIREASGA